MTSLAVSYQVAGEAYRSQAVGTAGPLQLVLMLYDRALAAIARSEWALNNREPGSIELAHKELTRAQDIVTELMLSLDHDKGGEISSSLNAIYEFCLERLTQAKPGQGCHRPSLCCQEPHRSAGGVGPHRGGNGRVAIGLEAVSELFEGIEESLEAGNWDALSSARPTEPDVMPEDELELVPAHR
jgi:flagellar biosynthetic protein FliS